MILLYNHAREQRKVYQSVYALIYPVTRKVKIIES